MLKMGEEGSINKIQRKQQVSGRYEWLIGHSDPGPFLGAYAQGLRSLWRAVFMFPWRKE